MYAMRKSVFVVLAILTSLSVCVASGFWAGSQIALDRAVSSDGSERIHYTRGVDSIDSVDAMGTDENGDGLIDDWSVSIYNPEWSTAIYNIKDMNFDGKPDRITLSMDDGKSFIALMDHDRDGRMDWWAVTLQSRIDPGVQFAYIDLDLDGRLDIMERYTNGKADEYYVRIEDTWTRAGRRARDPREKARIRIDGEAVEVQFRDGAWKEADSP